jgi:uncharacterized protein (TIGR02271 family)
MATTIVGLFDKEQSVLHIRKELESHGLSSRQMDTITWQSLSEGSDPWGIGGQSAGDSPTGRLAGELQSRGVPANDAQEFAEAVRRGGNLIITKLDDDGQADEIARLMDNEHSVDLNSRSEKWREHGYSGFNPNADLYSSDEVERERDTIGGTDTRSSTHDRGSTQGAGKQDTGKEARLQSGHEEVHVGKRDVQAGGIRVNKRVKETPVEEDVHLREEHARVERNKVDRPGKAGDDKDLFNEESIEVTEHAEEPVVEKKVHIDEEVRVGKEVEEHTETVRDSVRESVINIDDISQGLNGERAFSKHDEGYREHFDSNYGENEAGYDDYQPGYRFGHTFGSSDRYEAKNYSAAEPDIKRSYEDKHGRGTFDRVKGAAKHAYNRVRGKRDGRSRRT